MRTLAFALGVLAMGPACAPDPGRRDRSVETYLRLLAAEDARPTAGPELALLIEATGSDDAFLRQTAVRALGRLESAALAEEIAPHLADPEPSVRAVAAEALAQSVHVSDGARVLDALLDRAAVEQDPVVRGALAISLGRLDLSESDRPRVVQELLDLSRFDGADAAPETLVGVALGLESLVRRAGSEGLSLAAADRLGSLLTYGLPEAGGPDARGAEAGRVRVLALSALGQSRRLTLDGVRQGLADPEPEVRRTAILYLNAVAPTVRPELILRAVTDSSFRVVIEAMRYLTGTSHDERTCRYLIAATGSEAPPPVRVQALEALSRPCPGLAEQSRTLIETASGLGAQTALWQPHATALLSLARIDRGAAARLLPRYLEHVNPFVRTYAARTAGALQDPDALRILSVDPSPNVRTAALEALFGLQGHAIDDLLLDRLSDDDPQLLIAVAGHLEGSPRGVAAASAATAAFERISRAARDTWRDPRRALLERVAELGDVSLAERLRPFLRDYDAAVARDVAALLESWTGETTEAEPEPSPPLALPTVPEMEALEGTTVVLHMRSGEAIVIETLPHLATTNVFRFVRLARSGYYDGLTFHRWAPNFVIQGGSPSANEYQGDGPYTRDELGAQHHWRGTVGVSTRGHDTGDGQIFINLADNVRLDHDYTVIGVVTVGMDAVDAVLEGAVIERVEVRNGG